jgi:GT2 family glycosyltransferase/SAM-dependent methyltransferase
MVNFLRSGGFPAGPHRERVFRTMGPDRLSTSSPPEEGRTSPRVREERSPGETGSASLPGRTAIIHDLEIDLSADTIHSRSIQLIGHGKRVLEFGCATGYVSKILTEQFGCTVTGIEVNPDAAARARRRCHRVICGDAETLDYANELNGERFDVILFVDVLGHLKDPWAVLRKIKDFVKTDGYLVATFPNIAHATVALELLAGRFRDEPYGLLDDTRFRFFTRRSIQELFESAGYAIAQVTRIIAEPPASTLAAFPRGVVEFALGQEEAMTCEFVTKVAAEAPRRQGDQFDAIRQVEGDRLRLDLARARAALVGREAEVADLRERLDSTGRALAQLEAEVSQLGGLRAELAVAQASLQAVVTSRSWKLTSPLRGAKQAAADTVTRLRRFVQRAKRAAVRRGLWFRWSQQYPRPASPAPVPVEDDYVYLSRQIAVERRQVSTPKPLPQAMISLDGRDLRIHARRLSFPHQPAPEVSIVIPVYNNVRLTLECLTSVLERTENVRYEVVVANDASTDGTKEILALVRHLAYFENQQNLGFLRTCNAAASRTRGEYIVFLNNDVQVTRGWLRSLFETFATYEGVGAVGPKVLYPDGRLQEASAVINTDGSVQLIGLADDPARPRYNYAREVDYCSAVCLMVRREHFLEVGRFDERLAPAYYEDVDLCLRLRERGLRIFYNPAAVIVHHLSGSANTVDASYKLECVTRNRQRIVETWLERIEVLNRVRLIAFYLPQFHPIPENDRWWGKGFTEWTNVARAAPSFAGHYQPHLPSDLGFYDLRVEAVMEEQAALAQRYGIHGFCYYYYWFNGKRLLELPLERMLATGKPAIPFCLCWANENWTRRWDGREQELLIAQHHSDEDDEAVIRDLIPYFRHPDYIRINGRPLFLVYRVDRFPDMRRTSAIWRAAARAAGIGDIYLARVESFQFAVESEPPSRYGCDAAVEFPPHGSWSAGRTSAPGQLLNPTFAGRVIDYRDLVLRHTRAELPSYVRFRTVMPSWDNSARQPDHAFIVHGASPGAFQAWLEAAIEDTREQTCGDARIVFLNAWNEWAEGNHLEPDHRFGHGYLEAVPNAVERVVLRNARGV